MSNTMISDQLKRDLLALDYKYITASQIAELFGKTIDKDSKDKFKIKEPKFNTTWKLKLKANEYINTKDIETTVGIFLFNKLLLEDSVHNIIPDGYYNEVITDKKLKKLNSIISEAVINKKISVNPNLYDYLKRFEFWSLKLVSIFSPSFTPGLITPNEDVLKIRDEKYEGIENKDMSTMVRAEDELVAMSSKILKDDKGKGIFDSGARGSFENNYKNMMISVGPTQNPGTGGYDFIKSSYLGGISKEDLAAAGNIIINSEYPKAKGTAEGGYIVKQFVAIFQSLVFDKPGTDCKTNSYLKVDITENNKDGFIDQYMKTPKGLVLIDAENIKSYVGKTIEIRSPLYCKSDKICNKCAGERYYKLGIETSGITASNIGSNILNAGMKLRHDLKIKLNKVNIDEVLK